MTNFSPREIVSELDRFIVGQNDAKRAVAIALRNRWRRQQLPEGLKEEVLPKNILMIGPTGCGKTEISRRLAKLAGAPFLKVEATKFTEVGYVGRDVDSIVRDLIEVGIALVRETKRREVRAQAEKNAEERVLDALVGASAGSASMGMTASRTGAENRSARSDRRSSAGLGATASSSRSQRSIRRLAALQLSSSRASACQGEAFMAWPFRWRRPAWPGDCAWRGPGRPPASRRRAPGCAR